jgi:hypothetical protein
MEINSSRRIILFVQYSDIIIAYKTDQVLSADTIFRYYNCIQIFLPSTIQHKNVSPTSDTNRETESSGTLFSLFKFFEHQIIKSFVAFSDNLFFFAN